MKKLLLLACVAALSLSGTARAEGNDMPPAPIAPPAPNADGTLATPPAEAPSTSPSAAALPPPTQLGGSDQTAPVPPPMPPSAKEAPPVPTQDQPSGPGTGGAGAPDQAAPNPPQPHVDIKQEYQEYKERMAKREAAEEELENRALFAHEGGRWQLGLDYAFSAMGDYNFSGSGATGQASTTGGAISLMYFILHDIDTGRLGIGGVYGIYFSKLDNLNGTSVSGDKSHNAFQTYGVRLTYEFDYNVGQVFVPFVFLGFDEVQQKAFSVGSTANFGSNSATAPNYGAGLNLSLNRLEGEAASKALASTGIRKFYLGYTFMARSGTYGPSHLVGLKLEF